MEELELFEFVKIDKTAPWFDLPAYDPLKDEETKKKITETLEIIFE